MFPDIRTTERAYFEKTGIFPIMHAVAVRSDAVATRPSLPREIFELYSEAKQIAYADLETTTALMTTLPWVTQEYENTQKLMGKNFWPYGIEANRKELEAAMRYALEQGLVEKPFDFAELFHPSTLALSED